MFEVGDWQVDPEVGRLRCGDDEVTLQPQVMQLLVFLAQHPGEVISIDRMIAEVWEGKPMTSGSVYNALNSLRNAFGDSKKDPAYIETIPRRGYRLVAPVRHHSESSQASLAGETMRGPTGKWISAGLLGILAAIAILIWQTGPEVTGEDEVQDSSSTVRSIAVLPFTDLSPDEDQEYFVLGITEDILNEISTFPGLKVIARNSSFRYSADERETDPREIGQELGVSHLLSGSVRRGGEEVKISARLTETEGGSQQWSGSFDAQSGDVFSIQESISREIARELGVKVLGPKTGNPERESNERWPGIKAYDLFLLARSRVNDGGKEELEEAVEMLQRAIDLDPGFAEAHAELTFAIQTSINLHVFSTEEKHQLYESRKDEMRWHIERALELNPDLPNAHFVQGSFLQMLELLQGTREYVEEAESAYRRALELNPNDARSYLWLSGLVRDTQGSWRERASLAQRAMDLDPHWAFAKQFYISLVSDMPEQQAQKWAAYRQLAELNGANDQISALEQIAQLLNEGRYAEAILASERRLETAEPNSWFVRPYINAFYLLGAPEHLPEQLDYRPHLMAVHFPGGVKDGTPPYEAACLRSDGLQSDFDAVICAYEELLRGNPETALDLLESNLDVSPVDFTEFKPWHAEINHRRSPAMTLAHLNKAQGRLQVAEAYAQIEEEVLSAESEDGAIDSRIFSHTRARLHALRGEDDQAIFELRKMFALGGIEFKVFMEPIFQHLANHPEFEALKMEWIERINLERSKLGWGPLQLNPESGPGQLPFLLD